MAEKTPPPGKWRPGQSGNPRGRRPGSGDVAKLRALIAERLPDVLSKLLEQALAGDVGAARLLLERTVAPLKAVEPTQALQLPDGTLTEQGRAVLAEVANGTIAANQGAALIAAIGQLARVAEIDALERRIAALEAVDSPTGGSNHAEP